MAAVLLASGSLFVLRAQAEEFPQPDPKEILRRADAATRSVRALSYDVKLFGIGAAERRVTMIEGHVDARQERRGLRGAMGLGLVRNDNTHDAFRFRGEFEADGFKRQFDAATDGDSYVSMDFGRKLYVEGGKDAEDLVKQFRPLFMLEYFHPTPFSDEINGKSRTYLGIQDVGSVPCHVIDVVYGRAGVDARWYFGVDDYLPRRVDRKIMAGTRELGATVLKVTDLDIAPAFDRESFRPAVPPGFERRGFSAVMGKLIAVGEEAPAFELKSADGKTVELASLRGRVVVLEFWSSWCKPCKLMMPHVQAIHEAYANGPVDVFALNCFENIEDPGATLKEQGATYTCLVNADSVAARYNIRSLPALYVIGADGKVAYNRSGYVSSFERELKEAVAKAVEEAERGGMHGNRFILTTQRRGK